MSRQSAGILLFRRLSGRGLEVLLVHPGGPYWAKKDNGAWSIPKGEVGPDEDKLTAAKREFAEETGVIISETAIALKPVRQASGKVVHAFAVESDFEVATLVSNSFEMEWPPGSGTLKAFPEVDKAAWFDPATAKEKLVKGQVPLIDQLLEHLAQ